MALNMGRASFIQRFAKMADCSEAKFNAEASLAPRGSQLVLIEHGSLASLLSQISNLEFEVSKLKGTHNVAGLHQALIEQTE